MQCKEFCSGLFALVSGVSGLLVVAALFFSMVEYTTHPSDELVTITHKSDTRPSEDGYARVYGMAVSDGEFVKAFVRARDWYKMKEGGTYEIEIERYGATGGPLPQYQGYHRECGDCN